MHFADVPVAFIAIPWFVCAKHKLYWIFKCKLGCVTCQAGMRLDYKTSAHSENCLVLTNRIVKKDLFFTIVRTSGQSAAWIGSAHEESDAHKCRDRFEAPQNRHRLA